MIICYHTAINKSWANDELLEKIAPLPPAIKQRILLKRQHLDVQLSVCGNLLILALIKHFELDLTLANIVYNTYQRPYFNAVFDFNVSHSGNRVICCATTKGKVGIDIELVNPVEINYDDYFTANEQQNIRAAEKPDVEFFKYWTRKEAVIKAIGTGFYTPLTDIDVAGDKLNYKGEDYYLTPVDIGASYMGCIAHTIEQEICITEII